MQKLTAHEHPLRKIFSSDFEFKIPEYQRPYRWGTDQALQLLDDLEETLDRGDDEPYFLGSLVLVERADASFDVIDGQQRLTTLTLLFSVLRDLVEGDEFARNLSARVLDPGNELDGIPSRPRLTLREQDAPFFRKYVQEPGHIASLVALTDAAAATEPQRAIRDNAEVFRARLSDWSDDRRRALATLASTRTYLVVVSTPSLDSAYRIFSVMNARGLDLTPADIFKSRVIGKVANRGDYSKRWEIAEETLGSDAFTELFRDIRTVVSGDRARRELLVEFPSQVLDPYIENGSAADFVDDLLLPYAKAFERTIAFDFGPGDEWKPVNQWLKRLEMVDNKDWRPCALWAMVEHADNADFLASFLKRLERIAASFLLRQAYTTPRIARYLELLNQLKAGAGLDAPAFHLSDDERVRSMTALQGDIYRMQTRRARYVLLRLDELLAKDPGATYDHKIISIEHVLPQNPRNPSQWRLDFTDEQRAELTHKLGNLLLLNHRKNSQANNYDYATKKDKYFKMSTGSAVFALTTQVLELPTWTATIIEKRQQELTAVLAKEWELI
ncbi:DUF262 domain-containing HNH endonuclease family protein [Rhodococcus qingshengii]|uniref:DUF262 domain-containing protein n=1 Tax=Rhodococcus qingshengii TaxID=334542 RepID=UPI0024BA2E97|nr:DUF262 domain-containing HNH endonuclease family protein [Rhodococcus qingshengii]MDJ0491338.1 DUF262 domain-containing HNH endonuclease family protein [Rhodococcus qingshengii]